MLTSRLVSELLVRRKAAGGCGVVVRRVERKVRDSLSSSTVNTSTLYVAPALRPVRIMPDWLVAKTLDPVTTGVTGTSLSLKPVNLPSPGGLHLTRAAVLATLVVRSLAGAGAVTVVKVLVSRSEMEELE